MAEVPLATRGDPEAPTSRTRAARAPRLRLLALFVGTLAGIALLYLASALLFAGPAAFSTGAERFEPPAVLRFNAIYALLIAFTATVHAIEHGAARRDLAELEAVVEAPATRWQAWRRRCLAPGRLRIAAAVAAGALFGVALHEVGRALGASSEDVWVGHLVWMQLLAMGVFGTIAPMALLGITRARVLFEMGTHARVSLPEPAGLAPFARAGLRGAAFWLLGSSIASLLVLDATVWELVAAVNTVTIALGVAALLLPNRGVRRRLREVKRAELAWVHEQIRRARGTLAHPEREPARIAALPALLAWEARVREVPEWPFDASIRLRFALFLLVPLGSWLGGALVERVVDALIG